jgi:hypothetical protein
VLAQLADGRFVQEANRRPLALYRAFESLKAPRGVALKAGLDLAPAGEPRFELADDFGVTLAGRPPLLQDAGELVGEVRQLPLNRFLGLIGLAPAQECVVEAFDLRLQIGKTLFQARGLRKHGFLWRG